MNDQHNDRAPLLSQEDASRSSAGPITSVHDRGQETPVVILASTSIYRKELLARVLPRFLQVAPRVMESQTQGESVEAMALRLALAKARAVACDYPDALVIGSDQAATLDGSVAIGKPGNRQAAIEQLSAASGKLMQFFTALAVVRQTQGSQCVFEQCQVVETQVRFRTLSAAQIQHYVDREPAFDCAGAAKCEGLGISLMASIQSEDPTALIGLPLIRLTHMLLDAGYDLLSADSAAQRP